MTTLRPIVRPPKPTARHSRASDVRSSTRLRGKSSVLFRIGDAVFLTAVGAEAAVVMHMLHDLEWNFLVVSALGMAAAMAIQMVMAFSVSPLLGSIEAMAPSMVVAMIVPMFLDVFEIAGWKMDMSSAVFFGSTSGVAFFAYVELFGVRVRKRLAAEWPRGVSNR